MRALPWLFSLLLFALAASGVLRYGLTWDEPTYFRFAQLQRDWILELPRAVVHPDRMAQLLARETIDEVWLQHPDDNGHPPLNETWMGLAGLPVSLAGASETRAFRTAQALLLALGAALLYQLLRRRLSAAAALAGTLAWVGVPSVWAHGHIGATETMQGFFWIACALALPPALRRGGPWMFLWLALSALAFLAKFTNLLAICWVLGTAGLLGAMRHRRFWLAGFLGLVIGPLLIVVLDPFFWPWHGGIGKLLDYLRQTTTRGDWIPINVFYQGRGWGFSPPWHYRPVEILAALPIPLLILVLPGVGVAMLKGARILPAVWSRERERTSWSAPAAWPQVLGLTGLLWVLLVGWLPNTPNHDGSRQFVHVFVPTALLAAGAVEALLRFARSHSRTLPNAPNLAAALGVLLAAGSFAISLVHEPWGLSYRSEWIGGYRGAWRHGFELSYWAETISPRMLQHIARMRSTQGGPPAVHTIPKLEYFREGGRYLEDLLPADLRRHPLAVDAPSAFFADFAARQDLADRPPVLGFTYLIPPDALLVTYRRSMVAATFWDLLGTLERAGDLELLEETRVGGVPLARLYGVRQLRAVVIPEDPQARTWYQLPTVARIVAASQRSGDERESN